MAKQFEVPEPLKPWQSWVLYGVEDKLCPTPYNNAESHYCVWPTDLQISVDNQQGKFTQKAVNYKDGWIPLPGNEESWPIEVKINAKAVPVLSHQGQPALYLEAGEYVIQGQFAWNSMPDFIQLPVNLGTLSLSVQGNQIDQPLRDADAKLWFRQQQAEQNQSEQSDSLSMKVYRLFDDQIPLTYTTTLNLKVTGLVREVTIGPLLLKDSLPMSIDSPLAARIEENGMLRVQLRPGVWELSVKARFLAKQDMLGLGKIESPWPTTEVWSFQPENELRLVEIQGGNAIDPQQTDMPQEWKAYPSYLLEQDKSLTIVEKRRGQEKRPSSLSLQRKLWLDFSGKGFIAVDTITGNVTDQWRLATTAPFSLKRATVDGQDKLITKLNDNDLPGIEVRQGNIQLDAVSKVESKPFRFSAIGWDFDVRSLSTTLYLPPGWKLIGAWGADSVTNAWVQTWTLLDLFLVLIMAAAVAKLLGITWGVLTLVTMTLIYQEGGAPIYSWLNLIAALALYKVLPQGTARKVFLYYSRISFLVLIFIAIPFMVKQIREAIYPQLTPPNQSYVAQNQMYQRQEMQNIMTVPQSASDAVATMGAMESKGKALMSAKSMGGGAGAAPLPQEAALNDYDANAKIQTGPGIPSWHWDVSLLTWNGPVLKDQKITLWILPKLVTSFLKILEVALMFLLIYGLTKIWEQKDKFPAQTLSATKLSLFIFALNVLFTGFICFQPQSALADMPNKEMLDELKNRLTRAPECIPECAEISRMQVEASANQLVIRASVQIASPVALPLPSSMGKWMPRTILIDGVAAKEAQMDAGLLWLNVDKGVHEVVLEGPIGAQDKFEILIPLKPKWMTATANEWGIEGIYRNQLQGENLYLTKKSTTKEENTATTITPGRIPSFVQVTRMLKLGFDWEILTEVKRIAPLSGGIRVEIPLLADEYVLSDAVEEQNKNAIVSLGENQDTLSFRSKIKVTPEIVLQAVKNTSIIEEWQLEAISQWHCTFEGLPVIHQQSTQGRYLPSWYPWPGETLKIDISKPQAIAGDTLTIENSQLNVTPGNRATNNLLTFSARSSLGGTHNIKIPANATLQDVHIDGKSQPINAKEGEISLPIHPGHQTVMVKWQIGQGISTYFATPQVDLTMPSSNALLNIKLSKDRWILFVGGPAIGPAVLFWGVLIIILLLSFGLSRIKSFPLNMWQWFLLGIGLSVATPLAIIFVIAWFFALHKRNHISATLGDTSFKVMQISLGFLTLLFVVSLFTCISDGLLGTPKMQLGSPYMGNFHAVQLSEEGFNLQWYQDMTNDSLARSWVVSLPLYIYRILMLLWALWLAFSLIKWLQWGWQCFSKDGLWRANQNTE